MSIFHLHRWSKWKLGKAERTKYDSFGRPTGKYTYTHQVRTCETCGLESFKSWG